MNIIEATAVIHEI